MFKIIVNIRRVKKILGLLTKKVDKLSAEAYKVKSEILKLKEEKADLKRDVNLIKRTFDIKQLRREVEDFRFGIEDSWEKELRDRACENIEQMNKNRINIEEKAMCNITKKILSTDFVSDLVQEINKLQLKLPKE